jgi:ABC-type transport system substrate-binding protein
MRSARHLSLRLVLIALCALGMLANVRATAHAQDSDSVRLYEQEPCDLLYLKGRPKPLRIKMLPAEQRQPVDNTRRTGVLTIRLLDAPDANYEVGWASVENIGFFEDRILAEAEKRIADGKYDDAFDYFRFLQREYPQTRNFAATFESYLWSEAAKANKAGETELSLAMLLELAARNPRYDKLEAALISTTNTLRDAAVERQDFATARAYAKSLRERFPRNSDAAAGETLLQELAAVALASGREHFTAGRMAEAYDQAGLALQIWPADAAAQQLMTELAKAHPRIVVGVTSPVLMGLADGFADRGALRIEQLTAAPLMQFRGYGPDGAEYESKFATVEQTDLGRKLTITLNPGHLWSADGAELTGADVARRLLELSRGDEPGFRPELADLLEGVSVHEVYRVECDLARQFVKPTALLEFDLAPGYGEDGTLAPYQPAESATADRRFVFNPLMPPAAGAPREIVERTYPDAAQAITALKRGEITVLDRVNPGDIKQLEADRELVVAPYGTPSLHVLVPNRNRPLLSDRNFRRALVYGTNRQGMLEKLIWRGSIPPGNRVLTGPFPAGTTADDARGYAFNTQVPERPYDPRLALTLIGVARLGQSQAAAEEKSDEKPAEGESSESEKAADEKATKQPIALKLAHPASDIPRAAAKSIVRQWKPLGIEVELFEYGDDVTEKELEDYDLVYRELVVREPVGEARRLLGSDGALGSSNSYLELSLERLLAAENSRESRDRLRELHRLAAEDVTFIPLWQLVDHFAYHRSLEGLGDQAAALYQNVQDWRSTPRLPSGSP